MKLKKGDSVMVVAGSHKGKTGTIASVVPTSNGVIIEGVNVAKIHRKPSGKYKQGGVFEEARPINASNVAIVHPSKKGKTSRIGMSTDKKGKRVRVYRQADNKEIK